MEEAPRRAGKRRPDVELATDEYGEPLLPCLENIPKSRDELKDLVRAFLTAHLSMPRHPLYLLVRLLTPFAGKATKLPNSTVPWSVLSKGHEQLIDAKYLPRGFEFKDPSKLSVEAARRLLTFWIDRQDDLAEYPTFRFKAFVNKKGEITEVPSDDEVPEDERLSQSPRRKRKSKAKAKEALPVDSESLRKGKRKLSPVVETSPKRRRDISDNSANDETPAVDTPSVQEDQEAPATDAKVSSLIAAASVQAQPAARAAFLKGLWDDAIYQRSVELVVKMNVSTETRIYTQILNDHSGCFP